MRDKPISRTQEQIIIPKKSNSKKILFFVLIIAFLGVVYLKINPIEEIEKIFQKNEDVVDEVVDSIQDTIDKTSEKAQETIEDILPEPPTQEELVNHALNEINRERKKHGLKNVTLSPIECGQTHAENMLKNTYLSHWDKEGMKPYMRYTLADGKGAVAENCAWMSSTGFIDPFDAIKQLNWEMIYDDAESNWGHRDNLLDPHHNRVSIGIAYDNNDLFLVQDFEDYYFDLFVVSNDDSVYSMDFITSTDWSPEQIAIYYDPLPVSLTVDQLSKPPYDNGYEMGEWVAGIIPHRGMFEKGITIRAEKWSKTENEFHIVFDLEPVFSKHGEGVYTLVIWDSGRIFTTYSIWNKN